MTEEERTKIVQFFEETIDGGVCQGDWTIIESLVEEEIVTSEFLKANEADICLAFDERWFTCNQCGWTMPICSMSYDSHDNVCEDCYEENTD